MPFDQWTFIQYSYTNLFYMFFELSSSNSGDGNNGSRHGSTHDSPNLIHSAMRFDNCAQVDVYKRQGWNQASGFSPLARTNPPF